MDFDEKYLDELLKAIEPITGPPEGEDAEGHVDESIPDVPEEELESEVAEPLEMDESVEELLAGADGAVADIVMPEEPAEAEAVEPEANPEPEANHGPEAEPAPESEPEVVSLSIDDLDPNDGNKSLSADEIAALFNSANAEEPADTAEAEENADEEPEEPEEPIELELDAPELASLIADSESGDTESTDSEEESDLSVDGLMDEEPSLSDLLAESANEDAGEFPIEGEQEIDLGMSADEIDAMLNAAKEAGNEPEEKIAEEDTDELLSLLASAGDEALGDIQNLLDSDEKGEAVDAAALEAATSVEDVASGVLETEEEAAARTKEEKKAAKKKAKEDKKAARAAKKAAKGGKTAEGNEAADSTATDDADAKSGKGFFAGLLAMLTENLDDEIDSEEAKASEGEGDNGSEGEIAIISDENKEILEELDKEKGKKKGKKPKKEKKKKGKGDKAEGEEDESSDEEGEEGEAAGKKKKKKKKKEKAPKAEEIPARPEKKLPKKRVRATFILCFSIMAGIIILTIVLTNALNLKEARYAYDRQDYQTTYDDLYGLELEGEDKDIFVKSQIMLMLDRKLQSYMNYKKLGMEEEALNALLKAVEMYPDVLIQAESHGVVPQVENTYSQIKDALAAYGLSEADAAEINGYESKVKYTKRIDSIIHGTPFTYDDDIAAEGGMTAAPDQAPEGSTQTVDDILPREQDFLPDDPTAIFDTEQPAAPEENGAPIDAIADIPVDEGNI